MPIFPGRLFLNNLQARTSLYCSAGTLYYFGRLCHFRSIFAFMFWRCKRRTDRNTFGRSHGFSIHPNITEKMRFSFFFVDACVRCVCSRYTRTLLPLQLYSVHGRGHYCPCFADCILIILRVRVKSLPSLSHTPRCAYGIGNTSH